MTILREACLLAAAACLPASHAAAETGRIGNTLTVPVNYWVGRPDSSGAMQWTNHTIGPCETQEWSYDLAEGVTGLPLGWPLWADARKDEYGNVISTSGQLTMSADGSAQVIFFPNGDQIWLDGSSNAATGMENACGSAKDAAEAADPPAEATADATAAPTVDVPPPGGASAEEAASKLATLISQVNSGEIMLVEVGATPDRRGTLAAVPVEEFTLLIWLQVAAGEISADDGEQIVDLSGRHSKVLLSELVSLIDMVLD